MQTSGQFSRNGTILNGTILNGTILNGTILNNKIVSHRIKKLWTVCYLQTNMTVRMIMNRFSSY